MGVKTGSCIVGMVRDGQVYMAADSLAVDSSGTRVELAHPKVFKVGEALVGVVGSLRVGQVCQAMAKGEVPSFDEPEEFVAWFVETLAGELDSAEGVGSDTEWVALVGYRGHLYVVQQDFAWYEPKGGFAAEGAGSDAAWAVLWLLKDAEWCLSEPKDLLELAITAAKARNCRVGGEVFSAST